MIFDQLQSAIADRYKVERELGRGGMATVYLATDVRHERQVAIKVLHPDLAATIGAERFEREIKLAAKLQHPHILGLIDSGAADGLFYYVMPFIQGESVRDKLDREKQLSVDEALQITLEVADALGYAHAHDIVHRDIKPENVMMSNGHALVADFGIARARTEAGQNRLTQTGMAVGTPVYMSPEQATGEAVGPSADIYSLGCMLYEMLAGEPPFQGPNAMAIMARHAMEAVPSIRIIRPAVPEEVEEAILHAMEKNVADRPKTAAEFCELLGTPLGATATRRVTSRFTARHRIPTAAALPALPPAPVPLWRRPAIASAAIIGAVAIGFIAFQMASGGEAPPVADPLARRIAVRYFTVAGANAAELQPTAERLTESLIRDLTNIRELRVVSANGVAPFRGTDVPRDSVARVLQVGTVIDGTVEREGQFARVSVRLYEAGGANLGDPVTVRVPVDSLFQAEESVANDVSAALKERIGGEFEALESRTATRSGAAWTLNSRAERARKDAAAFGVAKADSARASLLVADSLLREAARADANWVEPLLQRVQVSLDMWRYLPPEERSGQLDTALSRVADALQVDPRSAKALELRGTVKHEKWRAGRLTMDPQERARLLTAAEDDLQKAVQQDGSLVTAYARLTFLYYDKKDVPASLSQARIAYQADEFLANSQAILGRLFFGSYDTEQFAEARRWCAEGNRRYPRNYVFTQCQLWLMLEPTATPDVANAWALAAAIDTLAPPAQRAFQSLLAQTLVGGAIGRYALSLAAGPQRDAMLDSARRVLDRSQGDRRVDPGQELPGYRAVMLAQIGDFDQAIQLLNSYVAANPDHSFNVGGNVHWWWRDLKNQRGFAPLLARTK